MLIEEPEAHLHVQVQQVFIKNAYGILRNNPLLKNKNDFCTQMIVSTHSSSIALECKFADLRYFRRTKSAESQMAEITCDAKWKLSDEVKKLTVEHKMAAERLGFKQLFEALDNVSSYKQGLRDGSLSAIGVFTHILLPLHKADLLYFGAAPFHNGEAGAFRRGQFPPFKRCEAVSGLTCHEYTDQGVWVSWQSATGRHRRKCLYGGK